MKARNLKLTYDKAKEFYNSSNAALKEIALQAFTEKELKNEDFKCITTMLDVLKALEANIDVYSFRVGNLERDSKASAAAYRLNLIRKALNKGQKMSFTEGQIWYPQIRFVTDDSSAYKDEIRREQMFKVGTIESGEKHYHILGGSVYSDGPGYGLSNFNSFTNIGFCFTNHAFLGCATKEIAEHMSRYFAREIFDAMYGDFVNYEWI